MKNSVWFVVLAVVIGLISFWLVARITPEQLVVGSEDGVVQVTALTRDPGQFQISSSSEENDSFFISSVYQIEPSDHVLDVPATIKFDLGNFENRDDIVVYWLNPDLQMWEQVEEKYRDGQRIEVGVNRLGDFALGRAFEVDKPNFLTTHDELLGLAPANTISYDVHVGVSRGEGQPIFLLPAETVYGGCNGVSQRGKTSQHSILTRSTQVLLDDVITDLDFIFFARWYGQGDGCEAGQVLKRVKG